MRAWILALWATAAAAEPVTFEAADGVTVHADLYEPEGEPRATILLFHQASGNAGEYRAIAPRLVAEGFAALAVDQRLGGALFMATNRTAAGLDAPAMMFDDAFLDMEAALRFVEGREGGVVLWGSGASAGLAVALAAEAPGDVRAVLAFSPASLSLRFDEAEAAARLSVPLFVTYGTGERRGAKAIAVAAGPLGTLHTPEVGAHGSPTLLAAHNPRGAEANWAAVLAFLDEAVPR